MAELLRVEGLQRTHGHRRALKRVGFTVGAGEVVGLVGGNGAGKSTLVSVLSGADRPNGGSMELDGQSYRPADAQDARSRGVSAVQQRFAVEGSQTVREFVGGFQGPDGQDDDSLLNRAVEILTASGITLDPEARTDQLTRAEQAVLEVLRVQAESPRLVLLDEVVATFNDQEIAAIHAIIREMASRGCGILYVSPPPPRIDELRSLVDRILVLRDGEIVDELSPRMTSIDDIAHSMFERRLPAQQRPSPVEAAEEALAVEGLSTDSGVHDVSFTLRRGEILGLTGLRRSGVSDLVTALVGVIPARWGGLRVGGQEESIASAADAVRLGIGYLSDSDSEFDAVIGESLAQWLMGDEEVPSDSASEVSALREVAGLIQTLSIRTHDLQTPIGALSGGDQQKIALAKWMSTECDVLILNHPTRGIDISSKTEIHDLLANLTARGTAVLLVSSEMSELVQWCHRILVLRDGRLVSEQDSAEATEDSLMNAAMGEVRIAGSGRRAARRA